MKRDFEISDQEIEDIVNGILLYATVVHPTTHIEAVVRDPFDDHIIACAVTAKADYIVTRDADLLTLKEHAGIKIMTPEAFLSKI